MGRLTIFGRIRAFVFVRKTHCYPAVAPVCFSRTSSPPPLSTRTPAAGHSVSFAFRLWPSYFKPQNIPSFCDRPVGGGREKKKKKRVRLTGPKWGRQGRVYGWKVEKTTKIKCTRKNIHTCTHVCAYAKSLDGQTYRGRNCFRAVSHRSFETRSFDDNAKIPSDFHSVSEDETRLFRTLRFAFTFNSKKTVSYYNTLYVLKIQNTKNS